MNWWVFFQLTQLLTQLNRSPHSYLITDEAFFAQPAVHQRMSLAQPDTLLLNAALFQATNEARRLAGLPVFYYDLALYQAAKEHAQSMIQYDYVSHENYYQLSQMTLLKRVQQHTHRFGRIAENIGQYQTIDTNEWYGVRFNARQQRFEYVDPVDQHVCGPFTYAQYARYAVQEWLHSDHHRANLLNPVFTHVGCAGGLSKHPYQQRHAPFGRLVQDFGALSTLPQASR